MIWFLINGLIAFRLSELGQNTGGNGTVNLNNAVKAEFSAISRAATIQGNGQVLPADYISSTLVVSIGLGTPPQFFQLLVDTGSYVTWLRSSKCTSARTCIGQPAFDASKRFFRGF